VNTGSSSRSSSWWIAALTLTHAYMSCKW